MPEIVEKGKGALTHKIGPLPLWGWGVAGVAAVLVAKRFTGGGGGSAGPGISTIPSVGSGASPVVNPAQNAIGGMDTATGSSAPPWWVNPLNWPQATPGAAMSPAPSTNGSAGAPQTVTTSVVPPAAGSWWTRLTNPGAGFPAGAAVTTIGGTMYSLSDAALARGGISGATAPVVSNAPTGNASQGDPQGNPWTSQWGSAGAGAPRTDIGPSAVSVYGQTAVDQMNARAAAIENR